MQIDCIPELALTKADDDRIAALVEIAFDGRDAGFGGRSYNKQRHHLRIIAREGDQIIGHIALLFRAIRMGDQLVQIVGLAEVATHPTHEGKGIASALLQETITQSQRSLADFIILFGTHPIYAKHGFQKHINPLHYVVMDDCYTHKMITRIDDGLQVLSLGDVAWDPNAPIDLLGHLF